MQDNARIDTARPDHGMVFIFTRIKFDRASLTKHRQPD
jgi:hypothetical protein